MKFVQEETRFLARENRIYSVYECPKVPWEKLTAFRRNAGYQNPFNNLQRCFGRGKSETDAKEATLRLYEEAQQTVFQYEATIWATSQGSSLSE